MAVETLKVTAEEQQENEPNAPRDGAQKADAHEELKQDSPSVFYSQCTL